MNHFDKNALIFNIDGCFTFNQICCTIATACILFWFIRWNCTFVQCEGHFIM